jgi:hypothetical protein
LIAAEQTRKEDEFMSEQKKPASKSGDRTKTTEPNCIELTEADLKRVSAGSASTGGGGGKAIKPLPVDDKY